MKTFKTVAAQIRPAKTQDIRRIGELAEELLMTWDASTTSADARRVYERILQTPDLGLILVAEIAQNVAGFAYANFEWRSEFGGETMDLVEVIVEPTWRNRGVGRALLNGLISHAQERKIRRFSSQVHSGNAAIERALESCGLDPEHRTVWCLRLS